MQFAEKYDTKKKLRNAITQYGSWYEIIQSGLDTRSSGDNPKPRNFWQESCVDAATMSAQWCLEVTLSGATLRLRGRQQM